MSSPLWQRLADEPTLLASATVVAETSLFSYVDASDAAAFDAAAAGAGPWLRAGVEFHGPATGSFALVLPLRLAVDLAAAFSGDLEAAPGPADPLVGDFAGEVANMICGSWLTRACREHAFDLGPPRVESFAQPPRCSGTRQVFLAIADAAVRVDLEIDGAEGRPRHREDAASASHANRTAGA